MATDKNKDKITETTDEVENVKPEEKNEDVSLNEILALVRTQGEEIKALREENAKIKASSEEKPKVNKPRKRPFTEKVKIKLIKTKELKHDEFVRINGRTFQLQRGKEMLVPKEVYDILENSRKQDEQTFDMIAGLVERSEV